MPFTKSSFSIALDELLPASTIETPEVSGFRPICLISGVFAGLRGSAYVEFGNTRVLTQIHGPKESSDGDYHSGSVSVTITGYEEQKLRAQMISALSGVIQLRKYAKSLISVEITVLNSDGGVLQAALLSSSLALIHAGIEVLDIILPCHVSVSSNGEFHVDPSDQSPSGQGDVTVAIMPNLNQVVCCDIRGSLPLKRINEAVSFAHRNCLHLYPTVRKAVVSSIG